jgi:hypothetical protein
MARRLHRPVWSLEEDAMATGKQSDKRRERGAMGTDDIQRGNVGTSDQGPGDVDPNEKVDSHTGEMTPQPMGRKPGAKR